MAQMNPLRAADLLIRQHGISAVARAQERRLQLLARGDAAGADGWLQVIDAIRELERTDRWPGETMH